MKFFKSFHPYALTTIVGWSMAYVLTRMAHGHFSSLSIGFLRYAVATTVLLVVCIVKKLPVPRLRDIPWFAASGCAGFFLYVSAFTIGAGQVTSATGSVILAIVPVITALAASVLFRERLKAYQWAAIAVEFGGILILTVYGAVLSLNQGVWWLLLAAISLSVYNLLQRKLTRTYSALQATTYSIFAGTIMLAVFAPRAIAELPGAPRQHILYIVLLGVFSSAIAYVTWSKAFEKAERTSMVSNYMFFGPFLTGIFGFLFAGEVPEPSTWIGGTLIISGALLFNRETIFPAKAKCAPAPDEDA